LSSDYLGEQIEEAEKAQVISKAEARNMRSFHEKVLALLAVDDFDASELARSSSTSDEQVAPAKKPAKKAGKKTSKKKPSAAKKASKKKVVRKKKS